MRVLTAAQMQSVDRRAIDELGIPGLVLMENASVGVADAVGDRFPEATTVLILCGPGNNGGDGLALARILDARGYGVSTFLVSRTGKLSEDAASQLAILERASRHVERVTPETPLEPILRQAEASDLVIDALFGTGLSRPLEGHFAELVKALDRVSTPKLAVDLPSGLDGSRGSIPGPHLRAELTVTFAAPKIAHLLAPACEAVGELAVVDLGIPPELVEEADGNLHLSTEASIRSLRIEDDPSAHKGDHGHCLLVGGSRGKSGAMVLAARAAVRGGAGLVTAAVPDSLVPLVDGGSWESMTVGLSETPEGELAVGATRDLQRLLEKKSAMGLGPGLGVGEGSRSTVTELVSESTLPLVLDADALNVLAGNWQLLRDRKGPTVLTPHPGEAARWLDVTAGQIQQDRLAWAGEMAARSGSVVVLKGFRTLIAEPAGSLWINPTGNSGMATGGSGDVLTGLLTALLGRGYDPLASALLAVYAHGAAGDIAADRHGRVGLAARDLITALKEVWSGWEALDAR